MYSPPPSPAPPLNILSALKTDYYFALWRSSTARTILHPPEETEMRDIKHLFRWILVLLLLSLAACGGGQSDDSKRAAAPSNDGSSGTPRGSASPDAESATADSSGSLLAGLSKGLDVYLASGCANCHRIGDEGGDAGPELTNVGARMSADQLRNWIPNPKAVDPDATMPPQPLSGENLDNLIIYLTMLK
jgi:mono/diheme cytochrome c family protein